LPAADAEARRGGHEPRELLPVTVREEIDQLVDGLYTVHKVFA
jgi:hypothetical protein